MYRHLGPIEVYPWVKSHLLLYLFLIQNFSDKSPNSNSYSKGKNQKEVGLEIVKETKAYSELHGETFVITVGSDKSSCGIIIAPVLVVAP